MVAELVCRTSEVLHVMAGGLVVVQPHDAVHVGMVGQPVGLAFQLQSSGRVNGEQGDFRFAFHETVHVRRVIHHVLKLLIVGTGKDYQIVRFGLFGLCFTGFGAPVEFPFDLRATTENETVRGLAERQRTVVERVQLVPCVRSWRLHELLQTSLVDCRMCEILLVRHVNHAGKFHFRHTSATLRSIMWALFR